MWFGIWVVLVLGALGFYTVLGWRLWRDSVKPLLAELSRAAQVTGELAEQVARLQQDQAVPTFTPDVLADHAQREGFARLRYQIRQRRADRRLQRRLRTYARWREIGQPF